MIVEIKIAEKDQLHTPPYSLTLETLKAFLYQDVALNYFPLLALDSGKTYFDLLLAELEEGQLKALLMRRLTGTVQFFAPDVAAIDAGAWREAFENLPFKKLVLPLSDIESLGLAPILGELVTRSYIAVLEDSGKVDQFVPNDPTSLWEAGAEYRISPLALEDLEPLMALYAEVFSHFSPKEAVAARLRDRGRGLQIRCGDHLAASACSEYETEAEALIVGVATSQAHRRRGLATVLVAMLCKSLLSEGKKVSLQYDNPKAGEIYKKIGFCPVRSIVHADKKAD